MVKMTANIHDYAGMWTIDIGVHMMIICPEKTFMNLKIWWFRVTPCQILACHITWFLWVQLMMISWLQTRKGFLMAWSVVKIRTICHAQDLWKLTWSCKQLHVLCLPDSWNLPGTALLSWFQSSWGSFEIHWVSQYLVNVLLFGIKGL